MKRSEELKKKKRGCFCPYCEEEIPAAGFPYCQPCGVTLHYCIKCQITVAKEAKVCPQCGDELE